MTTDEVRTELERAFTERRELTMKTKCLRHRLLTYGRAFAALADSPFEPEHRNVADRASDLREDWKALKQALQRIDELNKLLDMGEVP